jgi:hypothetical protein
MRDRELIVGLDGVLRAGYNKVVIEEDEHFCTVAVAVRDETEKDGWSMVVVESSESLRGALEAALREWNLFLEESEGE